MRFAEQSQSWARRAGAWIKNAETWQILLLIVAVVLLVTTPAVPVFLLLSVLIVVIFFGLSWLREFSLLMRLDDDVFPGRNDKLIWAILLIVMPPVGFYLFRAYRLAHWPETKPTSPVHDLF